VTKEWTPWNCVLLTSDEMRTHSEVKNIEEVSNFRGKKEKIEDFSFST
jgi:hypothetical protein